MLYLMQHGEAFAKEEDPDRPLTELGQRDAGNVARLMRDADLEIDDVFDSGKLRARETAEIVARQLAPERGPETMEGLGATDPTGPLVEAIGGWTRRVLLVSHMPLVGRLAAALLGHDEEHPPVVFEPATVLALAPEPEAEGRWRVEWMARPGLLRARA